MVIFKYLDNYYEDDNQILVLYIYHISYILKTEYELLMKFGPTAQSSFETVISG